MNALFGLALWWFFHQLSLLSDHVLMTKAVDGAGKITHVIKEFRGLYSREVVSKMRVAGLPVSHDYQQNSAIPLPATLTHLLGQRLEQTGASFQVKLRSAYPFSLSHSEREPLDAFEQQALTFLTQQPTAEFHRIETVDAEKVLRYAIAEVMKESCVSCHNSYPDGPKTDWQVGDVRGMLVVAYPFSQLLKTTQNRFIELKIFIALACVVWFLSLLFLLRLLQRKQRTVKGSISEVKQRNLKLEVMQKELEKANMSLMEHGRLQLQSKMGAMHMLEEMTLAKLSAEQANQSKSEFLAHMSHEVRTPMNGIFGVVQLLQQSALSPQQAMWVNTLSSASSNMLSVLDGILDFSKIESGQLKLALAPFRLLSGLAPVMDLMSARAGELGLSLSLEHQLPPHLVVVSDELRLQQVLTNLLSNALKFTPSGSVIVRISHQDLSDQRMRLRFAVEDTGVGLDDDQKANIFMPFTQADASTSRRFGGTGLGLTICQRLVELLGGEMSVKDNPRGGSIFWVSLNVTISHLESMPVVENTPKVEPVDNNVDLTQCRILVAEDNPINQLVLSDMLEQLGLNCTLVMNGQEAVEEAELTPYALILMDCQMPSMDGFEASREIRQHGLNQNTPIIAITANALRLDKGRCFDAGMNDYLAKPLLMVDLEEKIRHHLKVRGD